MKPAALLLAGFAAISAPADAQQALPCDWPARADNIVEPWEAHTRSFANGEVRLALLDTVEPASGAYHILILSPPRDVLGNRQCRTLGMRENIGFAGVAFENLKARYDPAAGLIFTLPVQVFDGEAVGRRHLRFTLNQATGAIAASLLP